MKQMIKNSKKFIIFLIFNFIPKEKNKWNEFQIILKIYIYLFCFTFPLYIFSFIFFLLYFPSICFLEIKHCLKAYQLHE